MGLPDRSRWATALNSAQWRSCSTYEKTTFDVYSGTCDLGPGLVIKWVALTLTGCSKRDSYTCPAGPYARLNFSVRWRWFTHFMSAGKIGVPPTEPSKTYLH
jgi:hypothetical protein